MFQDMTKCAIVEVVGINCVDPSGDGSGDLEIYGHLGAWRVFVDSSGESHSREEQLLYDRRDPTQHQSISKDATLFVGKKSSVMVIQDDEQLWVGGHLK